MKFLKEHLLGTDYIWKDGLVYDGKLSRRLFDRSNGQQVLFIINEIVESLPNSIEEGRKIEEMLANQLPFGALSEKSVGDWVRENYVAKNVG
jgi:hypothetical protein